MNVKNDLHAIIQFVCNPVDINRTITHNRMQLPIFIFMYFLNPFYLLNIV